MMGHLLLAQTMLVQLQIFSMKASYQIALLNFGSANCTSGS